MATQTYTFEENLYRALRFARAAQSREPCREQLEVVTKLEEAVMWNDVVRFRHGLRPLGLDHEPV